MKTLTIALVGITALSNVALAAPLPSELAKNRCAKAAEKFVQEWSTQTQNWRRVPEASPGEFVFRAPTNRIGVWAELHQNARKDLILNTRGLEEVRVSFTNAKCDPKIESLPKVTYPNQSVYFTDADLKKLVESGENGVIYTWSPDFVYSTKAVEQFKKLAAKSGLKVTTLVDPTADRASRERASRTFASVNAKDRQIEAHEILLRGTSSHYPKVIVYSNKKISPNELTGVYADELWSELMKKEVDSLK